MIHNSLQQAIIQQFLCLGHLFGMLCGVSVQVSSGKNQPLSGIVHKLFFSFFLDYVR